MIEKKVLESYKDYGRVLCISNGIIEAYVTIDLGPRIIRFGFIDGQNILCSTRSDFVGKTDKSFEDYWGKGKCWENFGGHRIWATPEVFPETYSPDDTKVKYELTEYGAIFTKDDEPTGLRKQLAIEMEENSPDMDVKNIITNVGSAEKEFSVWSITVCNKGGTLIAPMNRRDTGLLSNRIISVWPYTDMSDKRIKFTDKFFVLKQSEVSPRPIKFGFDLEAGMVFYTIGEDTFCKTFVTEHGGENVYPDGGCSFETYSCDVMTEVESLSPIRCVAPGKSATQDERWSLYKTPKNASFETDEQITDFMKKL